MSDAKTDMKKMETWYKNYTQYVEDNKSSFQRIYEKARITQGKNSYIDEYNQNVNLMNDRDGMYFYPFQKTLKDKNINWAIVKLTKDKDDGRLLSWFDAMEKGRLALLKLRAQIEEIASFW